MASQNEIKFEQPSSLLLLANKNMWMILGSIVLVILASGYFLVLQPKITSIISSNSSLNTINTKDIAAQKLTNDIEALTKSFNTLEASRNNDLKKLNSIVPKGEQLAELFVLAEKLAQRRGMSLDSIDVSSLAEKTATAEPPQGRGERGPAEGEKKPAETSGVANTNTLVDDKNLQALSINMAVAQTIADPNINVYGEFKNYLDDLESSVRLLDIESVSFSGTEDGLLSMNFTIKTYFAPIIK